MAAIDISSENLTRVAKTGNIEEMITLLEAGGDINGLNQFALSPLATAIIYGQSDMAEFLLNVGKSDTCTTINISGRSFRCPRYNRRVDTRGDWALFMAVVERNTKIAKMLIDYGLNININDIIDINKYGLLDRAAIGGDIEMMSLLIDSGANIDHMHAEVTPAYLAALHLHPEAVYFLINRGAKTDIITSAGRNIFDIMRDNGILPIYENLVREDIERDMAILSLLNKKDIWNNMAQAHNSELRSYFQQK